MATLSSRTLAGGLDQTAAQQTSVGREGVASCYDRVFPTSYPHITPANLLEVATSAARGLLGPRAPFDRHRRGTRPIRRAGELNRIHPASLGNMYSDAGAASSSGRDAVAEHWHGEVDVVCIGAGVPGLATAITVADRGGEVFVASGTTDHSEAWAVSEEARVHPAMCGIVADRETNEYFAALTSDLDGAVRPDEEMAAPVRVVYEPASVRRGGFVPPFVGSRLRNWALCCLASPSGYLYTRVSGWQSAMLHTPDGEAIEVAEVGSMTPDPNDVGGSVYEWLSSEARRRHIESHPGTLQRLVFENGDVVGAVFATSLGLLAIRARHGLLIATGDRQFATAARQHLRTGQMNLRVSLVGQTASRFGRVELLTSDSTVESTPSVQCRPQAAARQ